MKTREWMMACAVSGLALGLPACGAADGDGGSAGGVDADESTIDSSADALTRAPDGERACVRGTTLEYRPGGDFGSTHHSSAVNVPAAGPGKREFLGLKLKTPVDTSKSMLVLYGPRTAKTIDPLKTPSISVRSIHPEHWWYCYDNNEVVIDRVGWTMAKGRRLYVEFNKSVPNGYNGPH